MVHNFLAFDCGATSGRAVLATFDGSSFSMKEAGRFPTTILRRDGKLFWDTDSLIHSFEECLCRLGSEGVHLDSIGIDTWGVDFGIVAPDGSLSGLPRCYRDPYTSGVPEKVYSIVPRSELYYKTGIQTMDFNTLFQLFALGEQLPAGTLLFMPDLLSYLLTGSVVCEYTEASTSAMVNPRTRDFDKELLEKLGIPSEILLPLADPGSHVGRLKPSLASKTGLGAVPVVAVAGHDTASAIAAVPARDGNFAYLSSGTWSLMGVELPSPVINEKSASLNFTNEGGIEGTTCFLKNITGMWLLEQCRKVWIAEGKDYTYSELMDMAESEADFAGRIDPDAPRFTSPENMLSEIREELSGQCYCDPDELTDARIASCIFHSLADCYGRVMEALKDFAPFPVDRLHVIGGGSANRLLNQWTADATGVTVLAGPSEATSIGNVMVQAKAAGLVADRFEMRRLVAASFPVEIFSPAGRNRKANN